MIRFLTGQRHTALILTLLFAGLLPNAPGLQAAAAVRNIPVMLGDYRIIPDSITVHAGETVQLELINTDSLTPHNFTLQDAAAGLDVDVDISAGKTEIVNITPLQTGTYQYFCNKKLIFMKSHRERGMEGTLTVTPAAPE